jgi:hypothetical protein
MKVTNEEATQAIDEIVCIIRAELVDTNDRHASAIFNPLEITSNADAVQRIRHRIDSCITALQLITHGERVEPRDGPREKIKHLVQYCILLLAADNIHYRQVALEAAKVAELEQEAATALTQADVDAISTEIARHSTHYSSQSGKSAPNKPARRYKSTPKKPAPRKRSTKPVAKRRRK